MRITYAEITDMSQSACYLNLAWEDGREGSTRISLNYKCLMFYQWGQVSSLILDVNYMFWGVFTWWEIKALQIQALFFVHWSMRRKKNICLWLRVRRRKVGKEWRRERSANAWPHWAGGVSVACRITAPFVHLSMAFGSIGLMDAERDAFWSR